MRSRRKKVELLDHLNDCSISFTAKFVEQSQTHLKDDNRDLIPDEYLLY